MAGIMKAAQVPEGTIAALKWFRYPGCLDRPPRDHPVAAPRAYAFNLEVIVDVIEVVHHDANKCNTLSVVCNGTTMHAVGLVMSG